MHEADPADEALQRRKPSDASSGSLTDSVACNCRHSGEDGSCVSPRINGSSYCMSLSLHGLPAMPLAASLPQPALLPAFTCQPCCQPLPA
uniref:Uncharacterized protein n=1 Tax=Laticauda laticaudata TaxID=8630 RepID=A0A8C5RYL1_LATLA